MSTPTGRDESPRDELIDQAWRAASMDVPSDEADSAILAAARGALAGRDTAAKRHPAVQPWWSRWAPLAAAAGVAGLAFVLLQSLPREIPQPQTVPIETSPSVRSVTPEAAPATNAAETAQPAAEESASQAKNAGATAAAPAARQQRPEASPGISTNDATAEHMTGGSYALSAPHPQPPFEPRDWAARIVRLFKHGNREAAASEFRAFASAYPDAESYLPEDLRGWAAETLADPGRAARER